MKRLFRLSVCLLLLVSCRSAEVADLSEPLHVIVLHTNDVHGQVLTREATWTGEANPPQVGGIPRIAGYVRAMRRQAEREGAHLLALDAGDWYQGTPEGQIDQGLDLVRALARVDYDVLALGNHEFDHGVANVVRILEDTGVPAVCANVEYPGTDNRIEWVEPWERFEIGGMSVAVVGLVSEVTPEISHPETRQLDFVDPAAALTRAREELGDVDWILPLTHLGLDEDRELARAHPDLPLIVGGHSHTFLKEGVREGEVLVVQVGSKASAVGRVDLWFDPKTRELLRSEAQAITLYDPIPEHDRDAELEYLCDAMSAQAEAVMSVVVGRLEEPLMRSRERTSSSVAGNFVADAFRAHTGADIALMNRGGVRRDLPAGDVTRRLVFELLPFDNYLVTMTLSGAELKEMIRRSYQDEAHSGVDASGMRIVLSGSEDKLELESLLLPGGSVEDHENYRVTINSFIAGGGDNYLEEGTGTDIELDLLLMRDVVEQVFQQGGSVRPDTENRVTLLP